MEIKTIICPTDMSDAAHNATAYAAKLCQLTGATLRLLHVEFIAPLELAVAPRRTEQDIRHMSQELNVLATDIHRMFDVTCISEVDTSGEHPAQVVARIAGEQSLVVIGTNGADSFQQKLFGSMALNVVRDISPYVLVVPEGVEFATPKTMVFAWDYDLSRREVKRICDVGKQLGCHLIFVHISEHDSFISKHVFAGFTERMEDDFQINNEIEYERSFGEDVHAGLDRYVRERNADILCISLKNGRLIRRFLASTADISVLPAYPVLVVHHQ